MEQYNYTPTLWEDGKTVGTAEIFNNIELGIKKAHSSLNDININAKDYGILGDGSDESIKIQELIDYASNLAITVKKVKILLPSNLYILNNVVIKNNVILQGGFDTTFRPTGNNPCLKCNENISFELYDITGDGNDVCDFVFDFRFCNKIKLYNITVIKCNFGGLQTYAITNSDFINCSGINNNADINHEYTDCAFKINGKNLNFINCKVSDNRCAGLSIYSDSTNQSEFIKFTNCDFSNNAKYGVVSQGHLYNGVLYKSRFVTFINCNANFNERWSGFTLHYIDDVTLNSCIAYGNGEHGIVAQDGNRFKVLNCTSSFNKSCGLRIQGDFSRVQDAYTGVTYSIFDGNIFSQNGQNVSSTKKSGIDIGENCHHLQITNNIIIDNLDRAIKINKREGYTDCDNIFINNNMFKGNGSNKVLNEGTGAKIFGNNYNEVGEIMQSGLGISSNSFNSVPTTVDISTSTDTITLDKYNQFVKIYSTSSKTITTITPPIRQDQIVILKFAQSSTYPITLKNLTGNLKLGSDQIFDNSDIIALYWDGSYWNMLFKQNL